MPRTPIWKSIAATLSDEIAAGQYKAGDKLPTEAQLASRFGVNRHTVRHALGALADDGVVHSRRGAGVFVALNPTEYPIGRRVRYHQNLRAAGRTPAREILTSETRRANSDEADALHLDEGALVHVQEGLSLADGQPIALFESLFPLERLAGMPDALRITSSVTEALSAVGVTDFTRASTRLTAVRASATHALHLKLSEGDPLMKSSGVNVDNVGTPVEYGRTWFAGDRVTLTLES